VLDGAVDCVQAGIVSSLQPANVRLRRALRNAELCARPALPAAVRPADRGWPAGQRARRPPSPAPTQCVLPRSACCKAAGYPPLPAEALNRYLRAVGPVPATRSPRALIRSRTGLEAEALADLLQFRLDLRDRTYHLKKYPNCFVGTEAVQWMSEHFQLAAAQVVEIGRALQTLGLLYHVAHEQGFADRPLFFRLRAPAQLPDVRPGPLLQTLRERLLVVDRNYHGKTYPACWVGQEAVDLVCSQRNLTRHESELLLHRLMQFGLFEHVVSEHGFVDGHFFYRFNARLP
jgi:hypothetical protein